MENAKIEEAEELKELPTTEEPMVEYHNLYIVSGGRYVETLTFTSLEEVTAFLTDDFERSTTKDVIPVLQRAVMLTKMIGFELETLVALGVENVAKAAGFGVSLK